jgi:hypothetical protein
MKNDHFCITSDASLKNIVHAEKVNENGTVFCGYRSIHILR